jgi:hypothetical protein
MHGAVCRGASFLLLLLLMGALTVAQENAPANKNLAPNARLLAARYVVVQQSSPQSAQLPYEVIEGAFRGWGRYQMVFDPAKADLVVQVNAPDYGQGNAGVGRIQLIVRDAHDGAVLWSGFEVAKSAFKVKQHESNIVDASLKLFRRFRALIEPELAPE